MPISSSQNSSNPNQGFTLIEILVVLFIVTILAGLIASRLPAFGNNAAFDLEARRVHALLKMARNDAVLDSVEYGFRLTPEGYEFVFFDDGTQDWEKAISPFQPRTMDDDIRLRLKADSDTTAGLGSNLPPVLILSSGETTPFRLTLESKRLDEQRVLSTDGYSEIAWQQQ